MNTSNGVYETLDAPDAAGVTVAQGINDAGEIAGFYVDDGGTSHGFILRRGAYTTLDVPGALWTEN